MLHNQYNDKLFHFFEGILEDEFQAKFTQRADVSDQKLYTFEVDGYRLNLSMDIWEGIDIEPIAENYHQTNEKEVEFIKVLKTQLLAKKEEIWQEVLEEVIHYKPVEESYSTFEKCCILLSDLYLDNEIEYEYIAQKLLEIELSWDEINQINQYEVFPILWSNAVSIAGEWSGFDEKWLLESIQKNKKRNIIFRCKNWIWSKLFYHFIIGKDMKILYQQFNKQNEI